MISACWAGAVLCYIETQLILLLRDNFPKILEESNSQSATSDENEAGQLARGESAERPHPAVQPWDEVEPNGTARHHRPSSRELALVFIFDWDDTEELVPVVRLLQWPLNQWVQTVDRALSNIED